MLEEREIVQDLDIVIIRINEQAVMHMLGTNVSRSGLEEHCLIEASPDILRGVNEVLDAARDAVGGGAGLGMEVGLGVEGGLRVGEGEGSNSIVDGGDVGGDGGAGGLHVDDGVSGVDEVAVAVTDELTELFSFVVDLLPGEGLGVADLGDGFGAEERLGIAVAEGGNAVVVVGVRRARRGGNSHGGGWGLLVRH